MPYLFVLRMVVNDEMLVWGVGEHAGGQPAPSHGRLTGNTFAQQLAEPAHAFPT